MGRAVNLLLVYRLCSILTARIRYVFGLSAQAGTRVFFFPKGLKLKHTKKVLKVRVSVHIIVEYEQLFPFNP
jgi:hypothetical protein